MFDLPFHKRFIVAALVFVTAGFFALIYQLPMLMVVPFAWVLQKPIFDVIVHRTHWLFYLLIALLPLSTEYNFTPALGLDFPDEPLMMLLSGLVVVLVIRSKSKFPVQVLRNRLFLIAILQLLWILLTVVSSTNVVLSLKFLLAKSWYIIPFTVVPSMIKWNKRRLALAGSLLLAPMIFVVVQSLLRHSVYNFSFDGIKHTLSPFFRNHVNYSSMLVCLIPVLLVMRHHSTATIKRFLSFALVVAFAGVVFAYSRGAWLALLCGLVGCIIIHYRKLKQSIITATIVIVSCIAWLVTDDHYRLFAPDYQTTIYHSNLSDHLSATVQLKDVSNAERFYRWVAAANMFLEKPFTGFGPNTFHQNYKSYTEQKFKTWVSDNPDKSTVHNYYLLVLTEQGVPGLALFLVLMVLMIFSCQHIYHTTKDGLVKHLALAIGVIVIIIGSILFSSDLLETDKIGSLFWLCLGFIIVLQNTNKLEPA